MSFNYAVGLTLAHPAPNQALCEESYENTIYAAAKEYNAICSTAKNNPKEITILEIGEKHIILTLSSSVELPAPGKALRSFSQILLNDSNFKNAFMFGKQLFTSYDVANECPTSFGNKHISAEDIDDTQFLTSLVAYFLNKRDPDTKVYLRKRKAIEKMKVLAYECGIVKLDNAD